MNLSYNFVAPVRLSDGTGAVLKLGLPDSVELRREALALEAFGGVRSGTAELLDFDPDEGAMLIERARPGATLSASTSDDEEATRRLADAMLAIRTPPPPGHGFPHISDWTHGFDRLRLRYGGGTGPMSEDLVNTAEALFAGLLASTREDSLLHGDLHHDNVLDAGDGRWLAIDPKGVVGDAAYEPAAMLHNPAALARRSDLRQILKRRVEILCGVLGHDRERLVGWAASQAVLASCWTLEDHGEVWDEPLLFARTLLAIMEK